MDVEPQRLPGSIIQAKLNDAWQRKDSKRTRQTRPVPQWAKDFLRASQRGAYRKLLEPFKGALTQRDISEAIYKDTGERVGPSQVGKLIRGEVLVERWGATRERRLAAAKRIFDQVLEFTEDQQKPKPPKITVRPGVIVRTENVD